MSQAARAEQRAGEDICLNSQLSQITQLLQSARKLCLELIEAYVLYLQISKIAHRAWDWPAEQIFS